MDVDLPIPVADLTAIEAILRKQDVFCTSFPDEDAYSVALYRLQAAVYGVATWMVLDRNAFARIVDLANGRSAGPDHQIAAAIMAFVTMPKASASAFPRIRARRFRPN